MAPLDPRESYKKVLGRFVEAVTEELNIDFRSLGSRTCQRENLERGLEPDQCYYIENESLVWNLEQIDLERDPPPDLVIEIDFTSSSINSMDLYATLGVPEVWRYDGTLKICRLENEKYVECALLPFLFYCDRRLCDFWN
jgi:Uma2 family endonuclease